MRILIDMDGVISDYDQEFLQRWRSRHADKFYVPVEARTTFYVVDEYPEELKPLAAEIVLESGFFRDMVPVSGAKEALEEMRAMGFEVFICSSPLSTYQNCVLEKYEWVEEHLGAAWVRQLILTKDKTVIKGDFLIDDKPLITGAQDPPDWEHIVYDRPYNRGTNKRRITWNNWKDVLVLNK
ncbi:MAG: 5'-3'-deoxyribonucleotidase [Chloroflexi bacterium]|nr:MAG: 5'-3'-deoxyribonucleotidase [Chloroflexota bacterium]